MKVYQTDLEGYFTGITTASPDPMVPGNWLIPGGCIKTTPPSLTATEVAKWVNGAWVKLPNYLGVTYWLPDGSEHVMEELGVGLPAGAVLTKPEKPINSVRDEKLKDLSIRAGVEIIGGYTSDALGSTHRYPSDMVDQQNITGNVLSSMLPNLPITWTTLQKCTAVSTSETSYREHTATQIQQVGLDLKSHILAILVKNNTLANTVKAAALAGDIVALNAVTW